MKVCIAGKNDIAIFDMEGESGAIFPEGMDFVFLPNRPVNFVGNHQTRDVIIADGISVPININADEILLKTDEGSVDIFQLLFALEKALVNNDSEALSENVDNLDKSLEQILRFQSHIGNTVNELEKSRQKIDEQIFSAQNRLSKITDADLAESMIELNTVETNNKVSLDVGGRLIQPSLLEFLR